VYQNPVAGQQPYIANARTPRGYQNPVAAQQPYIANARSPRGYRNPVSAQQPYIANGQTPFTYNARYPANAQSPSSGQTPFTYSARYPANAQSPSNGQTPFTYNARYPAISTTNVQSIVNNRQPSTYQYLQPIAAYNFVSQYQPGGYSGPTVYGVAQNAYLGAPVGSYQGDSTMNEIGAGTYPYAFTMQGVNGPTTYLSAGTGPSGMQFVSMKFVRQGGYASTVQIPKAQMPFGGYAYLVPGTPLVTGANPYRTGACVLTFYN
jgi:hypothetical protein